MPFLYAVYIHNFFKSRRLFTLFALLLLLFHLRCPKPTLHKTYTLQPYYQRKSLGYSFCTNLFIYTFVFTNNTDENLIYTRSLLLFYLYYCIDNHIAMQIHSLLDDVLPVQCTATLAISLFWSSTDQIKSFPAITPLILASDHPNLDTAILLLSSLYRGYLWSYILQKSYPWRLSTRQLPFPIWSLSYNPPLFCTSKFYLLIL